MSSFLKKHNQVFLLIFILLVGFILRIILVNKIIVGDLLSYIEWGGKYVTSGGKTLYFGDNLWVNSVPNYPPLAILLFGFLDFLWQHRYLTAQLHNLIKFPPSAFIIYFYKYGDVLLFKLVPILSDLLIGIIIYKVILKLTRNTKKALIGLVLFVLNPITIFLSGGWGQTDSLVALIGLSAFLLVVNKKTYFGISVFVLGLLIKPSWGILLPFFIYLIYFVKASYKEILVGLLISVGIFIFSSLPFANGNLVSFSQKLWIERLLIPVRATSKISVSAFNFYTIFFKVDRDFSNWFLQVISLVSYFILNIAAIKNLRKSKNVLLGTISGIFVIGMGSFIFMTGMLERYFFPGLAPLIILMMSDIKTLIKGLIVNLILFANIIWSFYRRGFNEIDHPFTNYNFLLIRVVSLVISTIFIKLTFYISRMLQFKRD